MQTLTEKRVFGAKSGRTEVFVASETGLVGVAVSADRIGEFGLAHRGPVRAVAVDGRNVLIGTDEGVHYSDGRTDAAAQSRPFEPVDAGSLGEVLGVGFGPNGPIAADDGGTVVGVDAWPDPSTWVTLGRTEGVRAIDGGLIAAVDGAYRSTESGLSHVGLENVLDVDGHGSPLAATDRGLYRLANGWESVGEGRFDRVASDGHGHVHAVGSAGLVRREFDEGSTAGDEWTDTTFPVDSPVVDVAYGGGIVAAVTEDGTLCVDAGDGWRHQLLGVQGVSELAVGTGTSE
ncbi:MAG: HVO_0234 family beta-propeller protein [Halohasta sp.]